MTGPWCRTAVVGTALTVLAGCGGTPPAVETSVRGQVFYRGEPLGGGLVVFAPDPERGADGPLASVVVQADGTFVLRGLPGGWYRVAVAPPAGTVDVPTAERPYPGLPTHFRNPARSGLAREVKAGADNYFPFDLDD